MSYSGACRQRPNDATDARAKPTSPTRGNSIINANANHNIPATSGAPWRNDSPSSIPLRDESPNR